jgi:uncharacterized membrane protein (UPF0127 family)
MVNRVELMTTPAEMSRGMQGRRNFAPDTVMVFCHPSPGRFHYHMNGVPIDLDLVSVSATGFILSLCTMARQTGASWTAADTMYAIEAPSGWARKNGLRIGDQIQFGNVNI